MPDDGDGFQFPPQPRPYAPQAPDPGPKAEGMTARWAEAAAEARAMREARLAAADPEPRVSWWRRAAGVVLGAVGRHGRARGQHHGGER